MTEALDIILTKKILNELYFIRSHNSDGAKRRREATRGDRTAHAPDTSWTGRPAAVRRARVACAELQVSTNIWFIYEFIYLEHRIYPRRIEQDDNIE